ncbi:MAG: YigZ family protein [Clostridia bacterium]|nr:YigZ family protein [Clostridia bacterium]
MKMTGEYYGIASSTQTEIIIERSRFITLISPCLDERSAREILLDCKKRHYQATHNCYAYIVEDGLSAKFSDDGEPGGTAGAPIMEALKRSNVKNAIVIVTRYFGGIKLGAGGLTRAYFRCAQEGLLSADKKLFVPSIKVNVALSYEDYQIFLRMINSDLKITSTKYSDKVDLTVMVKSGAISRFSDDFRQKFNGRYALNTVGEEYFAF